MEQNVEEAKKHRIAKWGCCKNLKKMRATAFFYCLSRKLAKKQGKVL